MIFWKTDWEENKSSEQARSIIVWRGSKIKDSDIWLNAKNFRFTYLDEELHPFRVDLVSLVVHEMGHTLGLEHNSRPESVMFARLKRGYDRRQIDHLGDLESFGCEYGKEMLNQESVMALVRRQQDEGAASLVQPPDTGDGDENEVVSSASRSSHSDDCSHEHHHEHGI
jgi:hypothetical protein